MTDPRTNTEAAPTCRATKRDGTPCESPFVGDDGFCIVHDPARREELRRAQRKGGKATAAKKGYLRVANLDELPGELLTAADARRWASWVAQAAVTGTVTPSVARETRLAITAFLQARERADLERELKELRALLDDLKRERSK